MWHRSTELCPLARWTLFPGCTGSFWSSSVNIAHRSRLFSREFFHSVGKPKTWALLPASDGTNKHKYVLLWGHNPSSHSVLFLWPDVQDPGWPQCPRSLCGKRQKVEKPVRQPDIAGTGERPGTRIWQVHSRNLPAPQTQRATQQRSVRHMVGSGKEQRQVAFPPQQPPCDMVASHRCQSPQVHETKTLQRKWRQQELLKTTSVDSKLLFYLLFPWLCSFTIFVIKSSIHYVLICLFNLSICHPPPPFHLRGWVIELGVYQS